MNKVFVALGALVLGIFCSTVVRQEQIQVLADSGAIWTTNGSCGNDSQDVNHFAKGDTIFINGSGFGESELLNWSIEGKPGQASCDPGIAVKQSTITANPDGSFCFGAYTVADDDCGEYQVKVGNKGDNYRVDDGASPTPTSTPTATPRPTNTPTPTPTSRPTNTPTPTPTESEDRPTPTPTPTDSEQEPTPTPTKGEEQPTATPTITLTPGPGRVAALEYQVSCDKDEVKAEMRFTNDGKAMENVTAEFDYNGNKKTATSNSDGWAIVIYPRDGENKLTGYADGFYKIEKTVEFPDCPATGGTVLGATTSTKGQVLGATTYAKTGVAEDALMQLSGVLGTLMISAGALLHAKQK